MTTDSSNFVVKADRNYSGLVGLAIVTIVLFAGIHYLFNVDEEYTFGHFLGSLGGPIFLITMNTLSIVYTKYKVSDDEIDIVYKPRFWGKNAIKTASIRKYEIVKPNWILRNIMANPKKAIKIYYNTYDEATLMSTDNPLIEWLEDHTKKKRSA